MSKVRYYVPDGEPDEQKSIVADACDIPQTMQDMTDKNGVIPVQVERKLLISNISKNIYKNPTAAIREYVNNEARQCRTAIKKGYDASIHITVDVLSRKIIIEGIYSMGMSLDVFRDVYAVLGRSGNFDGRESGQFGFGSASYVCLSDMMVFETWSRETGDKFGFVGKSGTVFEPIPKKHLSIKRYGAKVTMTVKKDIALHDLISYVKKVSKLLCVPVFLNLSETTDDGNSTHESGVMQIGPVSMTDMLETEPDIHIDNEDYELVGSHLTGRTDWHCHLIGIPIQVDGVLPVTGLSVCIINVKDERKYMPTTSRDTMTSASVSKLREKINADIIECFQKIEMNCLDDYYKNSNIIRMAGKYGMGYKFNEKVMQFSKLIDSVNYTYYFDGSYLQHSPDSFVEALEKRNAVYYADEMTGNITYAIEKLNHKCHIVDASSFDHKEESIQLLKTCGIQNILECLKSNDITVKDDIVNVTYGDHSHTIDAHTSDAHEIGADIIKLSIEPDKWLRHIRCQQFLKIGFVKDSKRLDGKGITLEEFCKNVENSTYETSEGMLTGNQILNKYDNIVCWEKIGGFILNGVDHEIFDDITLEQCKEYMGADIALRHDESKSHANTNDLALAYVVRCKEICATDSEFEEWMRKKQRDTNKIFPTITDYTTEIRAQTIKNEFGINVIVDADWEYWGNETIQTLRAINNISVREFYVHAFRSILSEHGRSSSSTADHSRLVEYVRDIDRQSDGKTLTDVCIDLLTQRMCVRALTDMRVLADNTALGILADGLGDVEDLSERATQMLRMVLCVEDSPHHVSGNIGCAVYDKTVMVKIDMQKIELNNDCMMKQLIDKIVKITKMMSVNVCDDSMIITFDRKLLWDSDC